MSFLVSFYLVGMAFLWAIQDVSAMEVFDAVSRWTFSFKIVSWIMPPVETFEKAFGHDSKVTKTYRLIGDLVKYFGSLDLRSKIIEFYPAYKELKPVKDVARAETIIAARSPFAGKDAG